MNRKWIVLAEDDADDRAIFKEAFLEIVRKDLRLEMVEDGLAVINYLETIGDEDLPRLFILDQNMPKMTGKATLSYLKRNQRYKHIPVIIYTTYPDESLISDFQKEGAALVISKPDTFDGFKDMVQSFMSTFIGEE